MMTRRSLLLVSAVTLLPPLAINAAAQEQPARVTILFDAFGKPSDLKRGWGHSALIEHGGRRITRAICDAPEANASG